MRARRNDSTKLAVGRGVNLNPSEIKEGADLYRDWHWGEEPAKVVDWNDPDMPNMLIECGKLVRLHLRLPSGVAGKNPKHPRRERDTMIEFSRSISANSHIAYDPDHPYERLYLLVSGPALPALAERFWEQNYMAPMQLGDVARIMGGRQGARNDYPNVIVKPIGILTAVVYFTNKRGDGPSYYIHKVGEISSVYPALTCDQRGRLWLAGGNYRTPTPGITD